LRVNFTLPRRPDSFMCNDPQSGQTREIRAAGAELSDAGRWRGGGAELMGERAWGVGAWA